MSVNLKNPIETKSMGTVIELTFRKFRHSLVVNVFGEAKVRTVSSR